jgi:hypothetical protein
LVLLALLLVLALYNKTRIWCFLGVTIVNDNKNNKPLEDELLAGIGGGTGAGNGCGLEEGQFPGSGKCFKESKFISGMVFEPACPYCSIFTSMPEGADLIVAHIFECTLYGYVKRVKE